MVYMNGPGSVVVLQSTKVQRIRMSSFIHNYLFVNKGNYVLTVKRVLYTFVSKNALFYRYIFKQYILNTYIGTMIHLRLSIGHYWTHYYRLHYVAHCTGLCSTYILQNSSLTYSLPVLMAMKSSMSTVLKLSSCYNPLQDCNNQNMFQKLYS